MDNKIKNIVTKELDLPIEVIDNIPKINIIGNSEITIENHKGILSFDKDNTRIKTNIGILDIQGEEIEIVFIGGSTITISGKFKALGYGVE
ncbi:MAG: sporulation protein YqfC [Clostridium perfringens]|nr:sporulation protein YqfC [Clostridium perfringens]